MSKTKAVKAAQEGLARLRRIDHPEAADLAQDLHRAFMEMRQLLSFLKRQLEGSDAELQGAKRRLQTFLKQSGSFHLADQSSFTVVKVKCLECNLHTARTIHCPECGQHSGHYMIWKEPGLGIIFQHVPGEATLVEIQSQEGPEPLRLDIRESPN